MQIIRNGYSRNKFTVAFGIALLLQAITSLVSGSLFLGPFTDKSDIVKIMLNTTLNQEIAHIFTIVSPIIPNLIRHELASEYRYFSAKAPI